MSIGSPISGKCIWVNMRTYTITSIETRPKDGRTFKRPVGKLIETDKGTMFIVLNMWPDIKYVVKEDIYDTKDAFGNEIGDV